MSFPSVGSICSLPLAHRWIVWGNVGNFLFGWSTPHSMGIIHDAAISVGILSRVCILLSLKSHKSLLSYAAYRPFRNQIYRPFYFDSLSINRRILILRAPAKAAIQISAKIPLGIFTNIKLQYYTPAFCYNRWSRSIYTKLPSYIINITNTGPLPR